LAPAFFTATAEAAIWSSVSTEQGPAMTITSSPPDPKITEQHRDVVRLECSTRELVGLRDAQNLMYALHHFDDPGVE